MNDDLLKRLWLTYRLYHEVAVRNGSDGNKYATESTDGFLEYFRKATEEGETPFKWDLRSAIQNQIRILNGFIEIYEKPIVKDKITAKTRWTV